MGAIAAPGRELPVGWAEKGAEAMQGRGPIPGWFEGDLDRGCWGLERGMGGGRAGEEPGWGRPDRVECGATSEEVEREQGRE